MVPALMTDYDVVNVVIDESRERVLQGQVI